MRRNMSLQWLKVFLLVTILMVSFSCGQAPSRYVPGSRTLGITPNKDFFVVDIKGTPPIDIKKWRLIVDGEVENPLNFTYKDIKKLPQHSEVALLQCVEGPFGKAKWTGVRLRDILSLAHPKKGAKEVVFHSEDGYSTSIILTTATKPNILLALKMNDEVLPKPHGFPLKAVVPGKFGYKWAKWIKRIEVVDYDYKGYWESRGWDDEANLPR